MNMIPKEELSVLLRICDRKVGPESHDQPVIVTELVNRGLAAMIDERPEITLLGLLLISRTEHALFRPRFVAPPGRMLERA